MNKTILQRAFLKIGITSLVLLSVAVGVHASVSSIVFQESSFGEVCATSGQICSTAHSFSINLTRSADLEIKYTIGSNHCSPIRVRVFADGVERALTGTLGYTGPSSTTVNLSNMSSGAHSISLKAEGIVGGCNNGSLVSWGGSVVVTAITQPQLSISCSAFPNPVNVGQSVTFSALPFGGTSGYAYSWSGACTGSSQNCSRTFSNSGSQTATVVVVSGIETVTAGCSVLVNQVCNNHYNRQCSGGHVYWYDSCQNIEDKYEDCGLRGCSNGVCASCISHSERRCYGGDPYWYNSCGEKEDKYEECGSRSCSSGSCGSCFSHSERRCYDGDSYWYNSCGEKEDKYEECGSRSCSSGSCGSYSNLTVTCSGPTSVNVGQSVSFDAQVSGGSGSYYYVWSSGCSSSSSHCSTTFNNSGYQNVSVSVSSNSQSTWASCPIYVNQQQQNSLGCYNNDVYWLDQYGTRQSLYQDCGTGICQNGVCINSCECTSGTCCDGCHYKGSYSVCDTQTTNEYGCPWGSYAGSDVGVRTTTRNRYCTGYNNSCSGSWTNSTTSAWLVAAYCSTSQTCQSGLQTCQAIYVPPNPYILHYSKTCYNNNVFWLDSNGARQDLYSNCQDANSCTADSCSSGRCINAVKCDGTACVKGTADYCSSCTSCGDGACNCGETMSSCSKDCLIAGLALNLLGKKTSDPIQWAETFSAQSGQTIDVIAVVSNGLDNTMDDVRLTVSLPQEVSYSGNLMVNGNLYNGDVRAGILLGSLAPRASQTVTFSAQISSQLFSSAADIMGTVYTNSGQSQDSIKVLLFQPNGEIVPEEVDTTTASGFLASLAAINLSRPIYILLFLIVIFLAIVGVARLLRGRKE